MKRLRVLAWVMLFGIVGIIAVFLFPGHSTETEEIRRPEKLEAAMASLDGSLYDADKNQFGIQDFVFGNSLPETIRDLGLDCWYTAEEAQVIADGMPYPDEHINMGYGDADRVFSAFGGKKYKIGFRFSMSHNCYMLDFSASFLDPALADRLPKSFHNPDNSLTYQDACQYFDDMMDAFTSAYGAPAEADLNPVLTGVTVERLEKGYGEGNYAIWTIDNGTHSSVLSLSARPHPDAYTNDTLRTLSIHVCVGQTISDVTLDNILDCLSV